ncbi:MAG TPA: peptide deformylase [Balneolales bacterium]|nr:peptide deformylase [Balneolales bacterium]
MVLPILSYGNQKLNQVCKSVNDNDPELQEFIDNMWETLDAAKGAGLAAPQVNKSSQLFIIDSDSTFRIMSEFERKAYFSGDEGIMETFINTRIISRSDETWTDSEGCLSMPSFTVVVERPWSIEIEYFDRTFQKKRRAFSGLTARMIQHEYDHTRGVLFLDYVNSITKARLKKKLLAIQRGEIKTKYPMKFPEFVPEST